MQQEGRDFVLSIIMSQMLRNPRRGKSQDISGTLGGNVSEEHYLRKAGIDPKENGGVLKIVR